MMVALTNFSDKSIHPQEGLRSKGSLSFPFLLASLHKFGHNSIVVFRTTKWFAPSCSSRDSASGDISVIDIFKNGGSHGEDES